MTRRPLTPEQAINAWRTLGALGTDLRSTPRIAADLDVETAAAASVLAALVNRGWVARSPGSGGLLYWGLTTEGRDVKDLATAAQETR